MQAKIFGFDFKYLQNLAIHGNIDYHFKVNLYLSFLFIYIIFISLYLYDPNNTTHTNESLQRFWERGISMYLSLAGKVEKGGILCRFILQ